MSPDKFHGSWKLVRTYKVVNGQEAPAGPIHGQSYGYIHYLPDGRVSVIIGHGQRKLMSGDRYTSPDAETAQSARTMDCYAGTFEVVSEDKVIHHLDICSYENDAHADYHRSVKFEGDTLTLGTPAEETSEGLVEYKLLWQRVAR